MTDKIKVAITEDDKELLHLLAKIIQRQPDFELVGSYLNGFQFLDAFPETDADVVIMDIQMKGKTGIECIREAKPIKPQTLFIVSTAFENHDYIFQSLCAGASGYLLKSEKPDALCDAIRDVMNGGSPMSPPIARFVVNSFFKPVPSNDSANELSAREREIVQHLADGLIYKEIGEKLFISPQTVRTHIRNIYSKLHVKSKTEAINKVFPRS